MDQYLIITCGHFVFSPEGLTVCNKLLLFSIVRCHGFPKWNDDVPTTGEWEEIFHTGEGVGYHTFCVPASTLRSSSSCPFQGRNERCLHGLWLSLYTVLVHCVCLLSGTLADFLAQKEGWEFPQGLLYQQYVTLCVIVGSYENYRHTSVAEIIFHKASFLLRIHF